MRYNNMKRCKIVMLPRNGDKPEIDKYKSFFVDEGVLYAYAAKSTKLKGADRWQAQHLYIVSNDDDIREGDYWWMAFTNRVEKCMASSLLPEEVFNPNTLGGKKIVATTDKSLGIPMINKEVINDYTFFCGAIVDVNLKTEFLNPEVIEITKNNEVILINGFSVIY